VSDDYVTWHRDEMHISTRTVRFDNLLFPSSYLGIGFWMAHANGAIRTTIWSI